MMEKYNPPQGINLIYLEWRPLKEEVDVEFTASPLNPDPLFRKNMNDIRHELGLKWSDRLLQDDMRYHPNSPKRALVIETILNHPFITGDIRGHEGVKSLVPAGTDLTPKEIRKAAEEAIDVHEIKYTPQQAEEQLRLGSTGQKLKIDPVEVRQDHYKEQVLTRSGEKGAEYIDRYGTEYNVYLSGVIASG